MSEPLLATKLLKPSPYPNLVPRPDLLDKLNAGGKGILTLVSAPAGYGKTTLINEWIRSSPAPSCWLSLDKGDNDVARYFSYLIAALQEIHPTIGAEIRPTLEADTTPPIEHLLTALVNDIATSGGEFTLVLDDYHLIREVKIHQALDFLFDHVPPGMHTVLITRVDPPMALGRLRAHRTLTEIRESELRFSSEESTAYFNDLMELGLTPDELQRLDKRIEGWIAGLQLAALTLQGRADRKAQIDSFSGSHRHLIDYLVDEVLSRQTDEVVKFLLKISLLDKFNPSLCKFVTQSQKCEEILHTLLADNLFLIPLGEANNWYRFHHLFADFLRQRLRSTEPDIIPDLFIRASHWYELNADVETAIEFALAGGDNKRAARLLDEISEALIITYAAVNKLIRLAARVPLEVRREFPRLCIYHAWALQFEYQIETAEQVLALAEDHISDPEKLAGDFSADEIAIHARALQVFMAIHRAEYQQAVALSHNALASVRAEEAEKHQIVRGVLNLGLGMALFEVGDIEAAKHAVEMALPLNLQVGNRYAALSCIQYLIYINFSHGKLDQVLSNCEKGIQWIEEWSRTDGRQTRPMRMLAHMRWQMGRAHYERDELEKAGNLFNKATEYYELVQSWWRVQGFVALTNFFIASGDFASGQNYLSKLERIANRPEPLPVEIPISALLNELKLKMVQMRPDQEDLLTAAERWAGTISFQPNRAQTFPHDYEEYVAAYVLITIGNPKAASPILYKYIQTTEKEGKKGSLILYLTLQAVALKSQKKINLALDYLNKALEIGEREGYVRTFVDLGPSMHDLLQVAVRRGLYPRYVARLLSAFPQVDRPTVQDVPDGSLIEPLNERELQILKYMAAGLSDREIAEGLYLSINTVKWYDRQIYSKLGVHRRGEAVAEGRKLGLLS